MYLWDAQIVQSSELRGLRSSAMWEHEGQAK
jgi:hypothetical protein